MNELVINQEEPKPKRKRGRKKGDEQTYYTPRQKANAMIAIDTMGATEASRRLKIPLNTLNNWKKRKKGVQRDTEAIYDRNRKKLAFKAQRVVESSLTEMLNPGKIEEASYSELAKAAETATNVAEKLMDKPTERVVQEGISDESFVERVCSLAERIKQRLRTNDGGGEVRVQETRLLPAPKTVVGTISEQPTGTGFQLPSP